MSEPSKAPADREGVNASGWTPWRVSLVCLALSLLVYLAGADVDGWDRVVVWLVTVALAVVGGRAARDTGRLARARAGRSRHREGGNA